MEEKTEGSPWGPCLWQVGLIWTHICVLAVLDPARSIWLDLEGRNRNDVSGFLLLLNLSLRITSKQLLRKRVLVLQEYNWGCTEALWMWGAEIKAEWLGQSFPHHSFTNPQRWVVIKAVSPSSAPWDSRWQSDLWGVLGGEQCWAKPTCGLSISL